MPYTKSGYKRGRLLRGYRLPAETVLFADYFQRGPSAGWGSRWNNDLSDAWTIDSNNKAIITCTASVNNHSLSWVKRADGSDLTFQAGKRFFVEARFNNTTATFWGSGGISISTTSVFGTEFGVQKTSGFNSVRGGGGSGGPTNMVNKTFRMEMNAACNLITTYIDGVFYGTVPFALTPPLVVGFYYLNLAGGNRMVTWWDWFRTGYK